MLVPSSIIQAAALLLLVVPGLVLTAVRRYLVGPSPEDKELGVRLARAIGFSVALDLLYLIVAGRPLVHLISRATPDTSRHDLDAFADHAQQVAAVLFVLLILIPGSAACLSMVRPKRPTPTLKGWLPLRLIPRAHPVASAWDKEAPYIANCGVRIFTADGHWIGGWIADPGRSYVSKYPEPRDIFIEWEWKMSSTGDFLAPIEDSFGIYVPLSGTERVSWLALPTAKPEETGESPERSASSDG